MKFCRCGSLENLGVCSNRHCPYGERKDKRWVIDGKLHVFKNNVTYQEAVELVEKAS